MGGMEIRPSDAQEWGILPRHCALIWAGGKFRIEFDKRAGVYLNQSQVSAREFCNPFEDGGEVFTMRLGFPSDFEGGTDPTAPTFEIYRKDLKQTKQSAAKRFWNALLLRSSFARWLVGLPWRVSSPAIFLFSVITALWLLWTANSQSQQIAAALERSPISLEVGQNLSPSIGLAGVICPRLDRSSEFIPKGTAWLYRREKQSWIGRILHNTAPRSWVVTNAHVVAQSERHACTDKNEVGETIVTAAPRPALRFPPLSASAPETVTLTGDINWDIHPLHAAFERYAGNPNGQNPSEQPSKANVYDFAIMELNNAQLSRLQPRVFLTPPKSVLDRGISVLPGQPVATFGYPSENQPFQASGASEAPFEFRSSIQSRSNAVSNMISGAATATEPALYSLVAKSAGGMSGSPVIAMETKNQVVVFGVVFSASFAQDESLRRIAIGDGTYAIDIQSLEAWLALRETGEASRAELMSTKDAIAWWQHWTSPSNGDDARSLAEIDGQRLCPSWVTEVTLSEAEDESGMPHPYLAPVAHLRQPLRVKMQDNRETRISIHSKQHDLLRLHVGNVTKSGIGRVEWRGKRSDQTLEIGISGPSSAEVEVTILDENLTTKACPARSLGNDE